MKKSVSMRISRQLIQHYVLIVLICSLPSLYGQEESSLDPSLNVLDTLVEDIKQTLTLNTLTAAERNQCYDIIGSLGLCRPVIQIALERSTDLIPSSSESRSDAAHDSEFKEQLQTMDSEHTFNTLLTKFDLLKQQVIQQLAEQKIESNRHESAYTLVGSLNLCRPIVQGAGVLFNRMNTKMVEDQPLPMLEPEQPNLNFDFVEETP